MHLAKLDPVCSCGARRDLVEGLVDYLRAPKIGNTRSKLLLAALPEESGDGDSVLRAFALPGVLPPCLEQLQRNWGREFKRLDNQDRMEVVGALRSLGHSAVAIHRWVRRMSTTLGDWEERQFDADYGTEDRGRISSIVSSVTKRNSSFGRDCSYLQRSRRPFRCAILDIEDLEGKSTACGKLCGRAPVHSPAEWVKKS
jgi:hypothetical protein